MGRKKSGKFNLKEYRRKYYKENKEHMIALSKKSYENNKDKRKNRMRQYYYETIESYKAWAKEYHQKHRDKKREYKLLLKFGISLAEYNGMLEEQNGICPICLRNQSEFEVAFTVDHEHVENYENLPSDEKKKYIRGLICNSCNRTKVNNNTLETATRVVKYLKDYEDKKI